MSSFVPLRYYLPKTQIGVSAQIRYVVVFDELGGHLEPRIDVRVTPQVVPDRGARCSTTLDAGVLESVSLAIELTPDGLIGSIGTHGPDTGSTLKDAGDRPGRSSLSGPGSAQRDAEPAVVAQRSGWTAKGALRVAFNRSHPRTAALIADLSARAEQFLAGLRMSDGPAEVEVFGEALVVVERELAAADRLRREWIAAQGFDVRVGGWDLDLEQTLVRGEPTPPDRLPADIPLPEGDGARMAKQFGVLVVVCDPDQAGSRPPATGSGSEPYARVDELLLRRSRPVTVAAYRRTPEDIGAASGAGAGEAEEWVRDDALTQHIDVVDAASVLDVLAPQAGVFGERALRLAFHPDGSVKAFGVGPEPMLAQPRVAAAEAAGSAGEGVPDRADVAAAALEAARLQLALLNASDEFTRLAATHAHGGELATLEQDTRFAALRGRIS